MATRFVGEPTAPLTVEVGFPPLADFDADRLQARTPTSAFRAGAQGRNRPVADVAPVKHDGTSAAFGFSMEMIVAVSAMITMPISGCIGYVISAYLCSRDAVISSKSGYIVGLSGIGMLQIMFVRCSDTKNKKLLIIGKISAALSLLSLFAGILSISAINN